MALPKFDSHVAINSDSLELYGEALLGSDVFGNVTQSTCEKNAGIWPEKETKLLRTRNTQDYEQEDENTLTLMRSSPQSKSQTVAWWLM